MKLKGYLLSSLLLLIAGAALAPSTGVAASPAPQTARQKKRDQARVDAVLAHWIKVLGGMEALKRLRSVEIEQRMDSPSHFSGISFHSVELADGRFHFDLVGTDSVYGGFDGKMAWYRSGALGFGYVPATEFHTWIWKSEVMMAPVMHSLYPQITYLEETSLSKERCAVLRMTDSDTRRESWYFSIKSGLLLRVVRYTAADQVEATADFSDFRKVSGTVIPFRVVLSTPLQVNTASRLNVTTGTSLDDDFAASPADQRGAAAVQEILDRYLNAMGGVKALAQVKTRVTKSVVETTPVGAPTHVTLSQKEPNLLLREEESPGLGKTVTGFDGTIGWVNSEIQGFRRLKEADLQQWKRSARLEAELDIGAQYPLRKYVGPRNLDGRGVEVLILATPDGPGGTFYFDRESGYLLRVETEVNLTPKTRVSATADFADFRKVGDLFVPFKTTWSTPTVKTVMTYESMVFNQPLSDDLFKERRDD